MDTSSSWRSLLRIWRMGGVWCFQQRLVSSRQTLLFTTLVEVYRRRLRLIASLTSSILPVLLIESEEERREKTCKRHIWRRTAIGLVCLHLFLLEAVSNCLTACSLKLVVDPMATLNSMHIQLPYPIDLLTPRLQAVEHYSSRPAWSAQAFWLAWPWD